MRRSTTKKGCGFAIPIFFAILVTFSISSCSVAQLVESERVEEYHARNHKWPPDDFTPATPGWRKVMERRFRQIERIEIRLSKYNGWVNTVHSALICPNFTENGWGLTRAPEHIVEELVKRLHEGLKDDLPEEQVDFPIESENPVHNPLFIRQPNFNQEVLAELKPIHEAWSGVKLEGALGYGLRVYRNQSNLYMHIDTPATHVVSSILHVDHDQDSEPWPIVIEDFQGNTNEVFLESGDMLLYESSKCVHGRPRRFNGSWYSSIFLHYYPTDWNRDIQLDSHYRIPPTWAETKPSDLKLDEFEVIDTSFIEPNCKDSWCGLENAVRWSGPGEYGKVLSTGGVTTSLDVNRNDEL